jgi:ribosomal protein L32
VICCTLCVECVSCWVREVLCSASWIVRCTMCGVVCCAMCGVRVLAHDVTSHTDPGEERRGEERVGAVRYS